MLVHFAYFFGCTTFIHLSITSAAFSKMGGGRRLQHIWWRIGVPWYHPNPLWLRSRPQPWQFVDHDLSSAWQHGLAICQNITPGWMNAHPWLFDFGGIILVANEVVRSGTPKWINQFVLICGWHHYCDWLIVAWSSTWDQKKNDIQKVRYSQYLLEIDQTPE